jgi:hypothetical protein
MPIRGFPAQDVVACFVEPNTTGAIDDYNAARNDPVKNPKNHLDKIIFHSDFYQYEIAAGPTDVLVNHTALAGKTTTYVVAAGGYFIGSPTPGAIFFNTLGDVRTTDIAILNHGLGYVPKFMVSLGGRRLPDGYMVQLSGGNYRRVSVWANTTHIYLRESAVSGGAGDDLPATSQTYKVMVFRNRAPNPTQPLFGKDVTNTYMILARDIINSARKYLRRTGVGDTPFALNTGRTMDVSNGGTRTASGGVVVSEPRYNGAMSAPPYVSVGVD